MREFILLNVCSSAIICRPSVWYNEKNWRQAHAGSGVWRRCHHCTRSARLRCSKRVGGRATWRPPRPAFNAGVPTALRAVEKLCVGRFGTAEQTATVAAPLQDSTRCGRDVCGDNVTDGLGQQVLPLGLLRVGKNEYKEAPGKLSKRGYWSRITN